MSLGGRREKTQPDADGGESPDWDDAVFAFDLDGDGAQAQQQLVVVEFEVKAQVPISATSSSTRPRHWRVPAAAALPALAVRWD